MPRHRLVAVVTIIVCALSSTACVTAPAVAGAPDGVDAPGGAAANAPAGANAAPAGMSGSQAAMLNLSLSTSEEQAIRVVQSAAPKDDADADDDSPDAVLARQVRLMLGADPAFRNARVTIAVRDARVEVAGDVVSRAQGDLIRHDIRLMPGVSGVDGELLVRDN